MKNLFSLLLLLFAYACTPSTSSDNPSELTQTETPARKQWAIVIHGGGGGSHDQLPQDRQQAHLDGLEEALQIGSQILKEGGTAEDAVEQTIHSLENHPEFNAGVGASITREGKHELDASMMHGGTMDIGAVTGVTTVEHPISLARKVYETTDHVFFSPTGAEALADETGVARVENSHFTTPAKLEGHEKRKRQELSGTTSLFLSEDDPEFSWGTVGCVALDVEGNLVAGTSTGGTSWKMPGRIGDSPVIGAGTYASNETCGVSATGQGEEFIRRCVAFNIHALMKYGGKSLEAAADEVVNSQLPKGAGGIIAVDHLGNIVQAFNHGAMYRGKADSDGLHEVAVYE